MERKILLRFATYCFLFLLIFSAGILFISDRLSAGLGQGAVDQNDVFKEYLTSALPTNADELFSEYIDQPMEDFFNSSSLTSFYFSTEQYPVEEGLIPYLETSLTNYVESSKYLSQAIVYASTTKTYLSSKNGIIDAKGSSSKFLDDMIYKYNSNTLNKTQITNRKSNTFLFQFEDQFVLSKDLTTLAGTPHAIMFVILDTKELASSIYKSVTSISYDLSIYDANGTHLFSNSHQKQSDTDERLARLSISSTHTEQKGNINYIYCYSSVLRLQYILEVSNEALSQNPVSPLLLYGGLAAAVLLFSFLMILLWFLRFRKPAEKLLENFSTPAFSKTALPSTILKQLTTQSDQVLSENLALRKIVAATSSEAISSLFSRIIAGQEIEPEEARITLENTEYGFSLSDIYIAGILYHSGQDFIGAEHRYRILNLLNATFNDFKKNDEINLCAFLYDDKTIAIIASFVAGTSIAKGKAKVNTLKKLISEALTLANIPMLTAFGNMYSSIQDLSFSYNEAFRGIHYMSEAVSASAGSLKEPANLAAVIPADSKSSANALEKSAASEEEGLTSQDFLELIYRRAEQIAKLIWDDKSEHVDSLIDRTLGEIFESGTLEEQSGICKRLVSAVTSHMLSYPFVSDNHLSDVYNQLSTALKDVDLSSEDIQQQVKDALTILCNDFTEALKMQRNPYIMAAQEYIAQHFSSPELTLEEIAENLKIAPNYLSTIFSKNLGKRLFEYINEYRLGQSIELLLHTDKTINDISIDSGFGSSRNYIRIFKKYKGLPPGAYRKQHQGNQEG